MIKSLQSLRGIFALFIFVHHYHNAEVSQIFPAGGDCGVAFFFILSGFAMCIGYKDKILDKAVTFKEFSLKRLVRLYPLHLLCFLWALALCRFRPDNGLEWAANLFLVQSWIPIHSFYFSANAVGWCLCDLLFFYLLFPVLIRCLDRHRTTFLAAFVALSAAWFCASAIIPEAYRDAVIYINPAVRLLDFTLGIVLYNYIYIYISSPI